MGPKTSSGFYLSRTSAALLALLLASLLLALIVLGALYARTRAPDLEEAESGIISSAVNITSTSSFLATPSPSTTGRPGIWDDLRLPNNLIPLHYDLELWPRMLPDSEGNYFLTGQVNITIQCMEQTDIVLLHSSRLNFSRAELKLLETGEDSDQGLGSDRQSLANLYNGQDSTHARIARADAPPQNISITNLWSSEEHQYLVLELQRSLISGRQYVLELDYEGFLSYGLSGLFLTPYKDFGIEKVLIASELEPTSARTVYPCFDEPALKATFKTRIVHNSSYVALSNMPAIAMSEREDVDGTIWTVTTFNTSLKMSTYITAFVVCDFDYVNTTERGNEIRIWARKEVVQKGYASFALSIAGPILSFMEDLLNVTYPLQKTDFVAMPEFGVGAMENWGLITFREPSLIYNPDQKFSDAKALICLIVSHEIGHQWFGNIVTMKWWNDIWLNEGFASYMEYIGASFIESKLKMNELFFMHNVLHMFEHESSNKRAISVKEDTITTADDILPLFDIVTYCKGAAFVRMVSIFLTEKLFFRGLSSYLKTFSFSNADQDDLWNHLQMIIDDQDEIQLPAPLKQIMDSWTWKEGTALLTLDTSTGTLTQEQFKTDNSDNITSINNHTWIVPVSWIKNGVKQPIIWINNTSQIFPEMKITSDNEWIILNINFTGFYRANYDKNNWNQLIKQLQKDHKIIPVVNRAQLIEDAFVLAKSGYIEFETALDLTKYLEKEAELIVWHIVLKYMMSSKKPFINYNTFPLIKKYLLPKINPIYQHYSRKIRSKFDETADDYFIQTVIDNILKTACALGLQDCLDLTSELYRKQMTNESINEIPQSIQNSVYCYGIAMGNEKEWEFAWNLFNKSTIQEQVENVYLSFGLSCTKKPWLLYRYLQNILEGEIRHHVNVFMILARQDIGRHIAWDFLKENWQRLSNLVGKKIVIHETLIPAFGWTATSDVQFEEIQLFINRTVTDNIRDSALKELEITRTSTLEWMNIVNTKIIDWLQKNAGDYKF
ncbi:aminopeptidase Q [Pelodytes ibericus]